MSFATVREHKAGPCDYGKAMERMRAFTLARTADTRDELWLVEHAPVFTLGLAGRTEHVLAPGKIPVVRSDRGGQVTYHGPGQVVLYCLLDLRRLGIGVRGLVRLLEDAMIATLGGYGIDAFAQVGAPGAYVKRQYQGRLDTQKIGALGLRVCQGCTYHGISLNVNMDLEPFERINPCGYPGLRVTQTADLGGPGDCRRVGLDLCAALQRRLG